MRHMSTAQMLRGEHRFAPPRTLTPPPAVRIVRLWHAAGRHRSAAKRPARRAMAVENCSETVVLGNLADDPQYTEDLVAILDQCTANRQIDVLMNFAEVTYLNSSNIAKLLKLRKLVTINNERKLKLCGISRQVW